MGVLGDSGIAHLVHVCASVMRKCLCQQARTEAQGSELLLFHQEKYSASHLLWLLTGNQNCEPDWRCISLGLGSFGGMQRRDPTLVGTWMAGISSRMLSVLPEEGLAPTVSLSWQRLGIPTHGIPPSWPLSAVPPLQWKCLFWASQRMILAIYP